jgi:protein-disulfide isomerase
MPARLVASPPPAVEDVDSTDRSGVAGTPTFFINGRRHDGAYDVATLSRAVKTAGAHSLVAT